MHTEFLQDLAVIMLVAGFVTVLFHRFKQPVVLGYIVAGMIIGPYAKPIPFIAVTDEHTTRTLAELGLIFLMFSLGLHFSLRQLFKVGATALLAATLEIVLMIWVGYQIGRSFGWDFGNSLFLGALLSISSTTIIVKALADLNRTRDRFSEITFGILIVEDLLGIALIALLPALAVQQAFEFSQVGRTLGWLAVFLTVVLVVGLLVVPALLRYVTKFKSNEMLLVAVLGLLFGVSLLAYKLNYSVALGAFLTGAIIGESRDRLRVGLLVEPLRDMFSAVFFVAVGMLIDPVMLREHWLAIVVITLAVVVGKVVACTIGPLLAGHDRTTSLRVGMSMAQIGEFSFIIAQLGRDRGITADFLYPIAVAVSAITTLLTPYLIQSSDRLVDVVERRTPPWFVQLLDVYHTWLTRPRRQTPVVLELRRMLRRMGAQIALNTALVIGVFVIAAYAANVSEPWWPTMPSWTGGHKPVFWLGAVVVALPIMLATLRKVRAMAMLLAEISVPRTAAGPRTQFIRGVIAGIILGSAVLLAGLMLIVLSATILPPWPVLIVMLVLVAAFSMLRWRDMIGVYSRAQVTLRQVLSEEAEPEPTNPAKNTLPMGLRLEDIHALQLAEDSPAVGKALRQFNLRALTGASVLAIERENRSIINPNADEVLLPGDKLLLLGSVEQVRRAQSLLTIAQPRA